ncbi:MAG: nitronate monooxygenase [Opitutaceae bacterium]|nr:nitronate monooxygenase [Opitutaceae bacterium]
MSHPTIIQGGMGVAVSDWKLANAVSRLGALGVVSGTALAGVLARRLQAGDASGAMRRALEKFPIPAVAERILARYHVPGGKAEDAAFKSTPMPTLQPGPALTELTVAANFVEVHLAKAGHDGVVGINLLEKIQLPTLASLYGAMLARVDYVLMGAGIPRAIPGILDRLAAGEPAEQKIDVDGAPADAAHLVRFDPAAFFEGAAPRLSRPLFLAIVASATLAMTLARKSSGHVDGFVVECELAGGHNAPPRGQLQLSPSGEPVYGPRDVPELAKIRELGLPFWLAGSYATPEKLAEALRLGATGIQVGTAFAFCDESGIEPGFKQRMIQASRAGLAKVFTDPAASPTGFPFKVAELAGTLSEPEVFAARERVCDLGFLREPYRQADGSVGYRCAAEPVDDYVRKGGNLADTVGRKCLCNGLMATAGFAQVRDRIAEPAIVTAGNEVTDLARLLPHGADRYAAADVLHYLQGTPA